MAAIPGSAIPDRPVLEGLEAKWGEAWETQGTYRFDREAALASREAGSRQARPPGGSTT